ncbi:flagellar biosynthetic protein FliQ [Vibrio owensii]|uniref:flagellar biosynthetic protein FliQ n=1 Tax=Vibrio owensii TaxID=696485 RepID=UPI0018F1555B|nr:flagellar biosynthetic protein FliQ [Vibrio owensii]
MTAEQIIYVLTQVLWFVISGVTVLILPSLVVGLVIAIIQAVTQVNEQTLSFLPRLLITLITIAFTSHWFFIEFSDLFNFILSNLST